jgi:L-lactate utilization protein LutB
LRAQRHNRIERVFPIHLPSFLARSAASCENAISTFPNRETHAYITFNHFYMASHDAECRATRMRRPDRVKSEATGLMRLSCAGRDRDMADIDSETRRFLRQKAVPLTVLSAASFQGGREREAARRRRLNDLPDTARLRAIAASRRQMTVDDLDDHLARFVDAATANGDMVNRVDQPAVAFRIAGSDGVAAALLASEISLPTVAAVFLIAETGHVCVLSDDPSPTTPPAVVAGIDAVVPTLSDLAVILKLFQRNSQGRAMARRTLMLGGPGRADDEPALRIILLDHGRSALRDGPYRDLLRCIGCNACGVVCPVYRPMTVQLPVVRALLDPLLMDKSPNLAWASTRCGACGDACPVGIDLPDLLDKIRRRQFARGMTPFHHRIRHRFWGWIARSPFRCRWFLRWRRRVWRVRPVAGLPSPAKKSFQDLWRES